jgi:CDP-glucose 4,6-dehydratase
MERSFWCGRRVLVTGHTGFKGAWLTLWLLTQGANVWGYSLPRESGYSLYNGLNLECVAVARAWGHLTGWYGDINDAARLQACVMEAQPEVVIHLAAQSLVRRSYAEPLDTWQTNVLGSLQLLECLRSLVNPCAVVMVTTDKVYENRGWAYGYRECDRLGGHDPYSASKAAMELAVASWRASYCGSAPHQTPYLSVATARAGNVIGGGDWAVDRIVPDAIRALMAQKSIAVRNAGATRPWQHVLEPLGGYLLLAQRLFEQHENHSLNPLAKAFNFGPAVGSNRTVQELIEIIVANWPGVWIDEPKNDGLQEAALLYLVSDCARQMLNWQGRWDFQVTVARTVAWYKQVANGESPLDCCLSDLDAFAETSRVV